MPQLLIRNGPLAGTGFKLTAFPVTIGRDPSNDLALDDGNASEFHAEILETEAGLVIEDLGSSNGTWLNGERVEEGTLKEGDTVHVGVTELTFVTTDASATALLSEEEEKAVPEPHTEHLPSQGRRRRVHRVEENEPAPVYAQPEDSATLKRGPLLSAKSIVIALAVLAVLAVPAYLMSFLGGGAVHKALRYAPDGFPVLVHAKVAAIQKSDIFKKLAPAGVSSLPEVGGIEKEMRGIFGVGAEDIESATAFVVPSREEVTVVLKCRKAIDLALMQTDGPAGRFKKTRVGEHEVYSSPQGVKAVFLPDKKTLVASTMAQLETALMRGRDAERTQGMKQAMSKISKQASLALAVDGAMLAAPGLPGNIPRIPGLDLAEAVRAFTLNVGLGSNVKIDWSILCKDKKTAEDLSKIAAAGLVAAKAQLKTLPPAVAPLLDTVKISTSGATINSHARIEAELLTVAIGGRSTIGRPAPTETSTATEAISPPASGGAEAISPPASGGGTEAISPPASGGGTEAISPPASGGGTEAISPPASGGGTEAISPPAGGGGTEAISPPAGGGSNPLAAATKASQANRARQCVLALTMYSLDNGGTFPASLDQLSTDGYLKSADLLQWENSAQWTYFQGLSSSSPASHVVLASPGLTSGGERIVGFVDSRVQTMSDADFQQLLRQNGQTMP